MSVEAPLHAIVYPDTDGEPMAENTVQYRWITTIVGGIEVLFKDDPAVFVAGDLFWYPVQGDPNTRVAPDALVAFGRPKGDRGSYKQWEEGGTAPQVVFAVLSPGNRPAEMRRKLQFYDRFQVEEYYLIDPGPPAVLKGWTRQGKGLRRVSKMNGWTSPRLGVRFEKTGEDVRIIRPDGARFLTPLELAERAETAERRADRLAERLRALGLDPDA